MADTQISHDQLIALIPGIGYPARSPLEQIADALTAVGAGLILAALIWMILTRLPGLTARRTPAAQPPTPRDPDGPAAQAQLLHQLKTTNPAAFRDLSDRLYIRGREPDVAELREWLRSDG